MQTVSTLDQLKDSLAGRPTCVTIGVFDGVHLGHQALVAKAVDVAREYGLVPVALTFRNHPLSVLAPPYTPRRLVTPARKAALLHGLGIEIVVMVDFSREFAAMAPQAFIQQCLVSKANAAKVVCGYDFSFGCQGAGNLTLLRELGAKYHFDVFDVEAVSRENHPVKSTHIRDLLSAGHVAETVALLTRPHEVPGVVGSGMQRGRTIGFPTANLQALDNYQVPAGGVYLCGARVGTEVDIRPAMVNIGTSPTFGDNAVTVEAHILDFRGDIHGEPLSLFFMDRLRDERKFSGIDALVEQLQKDREQTAAMWSSEAIMEMIRTVPGPVDHHAE